MKNKLDKYFRDKLQDREVPFDSALWEKIKPALKHEMQNGYTRIWRNWFFSKSFILSLFGFLLLGLVGVSIYQTILKEKMATQTSSYSDLADELPLSETNFSKDTSEQISTPYIETLNKNSKQENYDLQNTILTNQNNNTLIQNKHEVDKENKLSKKPSHANGRNIYEQSLEEVKNRSEELLSGNSKSEESDSYERITLDHSSFPAKSGEKSSEQFPDNEINLNQSVSAENKNNVIKSTQVKRYAEIALPQENIEESRQKMSISLLENLPKFLRMIEPDFHPLPTSPIKPIKKIDEGHTILAFEAFYQTNSSTGIGMRITKDFGAGNEIYGGLGVQYLAGSHEVIARDSIVKYSFGVSQSTRQFNDVARYQLILPVGINHNLGKLLLTGGLEFNYLLANRVNIVDPQEILADPAPAVWIDLPPQNKIRYLTNIGVGYQLTRKFRVFGTLRYYLNPRFGVGITDLGILSIPSDPSYFFNLKMTYDLFK